MFGQRDGIAVGHSLLAVNGVPVSQNNPRLLDDGREVMTGHGCHRLEGELPSEPQIRAPP